MANPSVIALIPARGGSKRIARKNLREIGGHPLLAFTIAAAHQSGIFDLVYVSTEDEEIGLAARRYGAIWFPRAPEFAADDSPDIAWVTEILANQLQRGRPWDCYALLRPTSPFRSAETIRRAWAQWIEQGERFDSLRAVERTTTHPGKCWVIETAPDGTECLEPFAYRDWTNPPAHSRSTQSLPPVWSQTASIEIAWTKTIIEKHSISGDRIMPFLDTWPESHDLNTLADWILAEALVIRGEATLPEVTL